MAPREGSLEAPTRYPLNWKEASFYDEASLFQELERVFDICHGCRRCVSLCHAFPTLFDLVDESSTMEVDGVTKDDYWQVVDNCYLCDLCYLTKCPYVPPHEWNLDFPHVMLRAKALKFKQQGASSRDQMLSATDTVGKLAGLPIVAQAVNFINTLKPIRQLMQSGIGIHADAVLPKYHSQSFRASYKDSKIREVDAGEKTTGKIALFATCYCNVNEPQLNKDLVAIFEHNGIQTTIAEKEHCCGMPKLELGDLEAVEKAKQVNIPVLAALVDAGYDLVAAVPSCVLMFKQELPLMFPDDMDVIKVQQAFFDPFEYLMLRHKEAKLKLDFKKPLGKIAYQVACHLRVQKIGLKTRDLLQLVRETQVMPIERCSGHDGTYAVKVEFHKISMKIVRPVVNKVKQFDADYYSSDCPMAGHQIENGLQENGEPVASPIHPLSLLRKAYDI